MKLSKQAIDEFKKLYKAVNKKDITTAEAKELAESFMNLLIISMTKTTKD